jgi:hypothetical protein
MNLLDCHKMLGILAELMNKLGYQPMPVLTRAEAGYARQTSNSAKILHVVAIFGGIFAFCGAVALCLVAFNASSPRAVESKAASQVYPAVPASHENGLDAPSAHANQARHDTIGDDRAILDQPPVPAQSASSPPAPIPQDSTSLNDNELHKGDHPESAGTISEKPMMSEVARKKLEMERQRAERHRADLEESYQDHAISRETYEKGQEQYRSAIEKYRSEMKVRTRNQTRAESSEAAPQTSEGYSAVR